MQLIAIERGIDWIHVPYNSDVQAAQGVLGRQVDATAAASGLAEVATGNDGQWRLLLVFNRNRLPQFP